LDDLASLDPDLYRNLTYLKHFDGDVSELQLTFSVDEEVLGRLSTFDIIPGGRATPVTDSNK
jgi:ubiquitin-protein ligase E3 B